MASVSLSRGRHRIILNELRPAVDSLEEIDEPNEENKLVNKDGEPPVHEESSTQNQETNDNRNIATKVQFKMQNIANRHLTGARIHTEGKVAK